MIFVHEKPQEINLPSMGFFFFVKDSSKISLNKITINKIKSATNGVKSCEKKKVDPGVHLKLAIVTRL